MPENKKIKNITKEIIEKYDLKFDSSTSKMFKCSYMIEYHKYHKYMLSQVPVHPFGFATVPVDVVSWFPWFLVDQSSLWWGEETSSHLDCDWTGCYLIFIVDVRKPVCDDVDLDDVDAVDWWKPVSGYWYWIQDTGYRMTDDWVDISDVDDNECGRFSISSWLVWCPTP